MTTSAAGRLWRLSGADGFLQFRDGSGFVDPILQIIPEADIVFATGSHQTEENVRSLRAGETPMAVSDFSLDDFLSCLHSAHSGDSF